MREYYPRGSVLARHQKQATRWARQAEVLTALSKLTPREIYSGLLFIGQLRHYKPGWVRFAFHELLGKWPKPLSPVQPERPPVELEEWLALRKKKPTGAGVVRTRRPRPTVPTTSGEDD
jgi:hypothetical protein